MDLGLQDKVAIITGGSYGIGKAAAMSMAEEGARVVIVARRPEVLEEAAQDIRTATESMVLPVTADVAGSDTATRVVKATMDNLGRIDILVNNAGVSMAKPMEEVSDEDWESDFELKVWGAIRLIRSVIPEMRKDVYQQSVAARGIPLGRVGETREAGEVIAFLASERASYLTGIAVNIDGGTSSVV